MTAPRTSGVALAVGLALGLTACTTVGPDYRLPDAAMQNRPAAQAAFVGADAPGVRADPLPANWWRLYRDPTLDGLVAEAFATNTRLRVAAANLARAHAILHEAESANEPVGQLGASAAREKISGESFLLNKNIAPLSLGNGGIAASYQLDLFGQLRRLTEAAEADAEASQAAVELVRINVAAGVAQAYVEACSAGQQLALAQRMLQEQAERLAVSRKLVEAGRGTETDISRAKGQVEQARARLPAFEAQRSKALFTLATLTGHPPAEYPKAVAACTQLPQLALPIPVGDGAALLKRRPDVRQAERGLAAATARIGVATAALYPSVSIGLSAGLTGVLADLGQPETQRWSAGPLIRWTIPGGVEHARVAIAKAGADAALARFDGAVLGALQDTETALAVYARELDRNAALRAARHEAAEEAHHARSLYRAGRSPYLDDLDARRALTAADAAVAASDNRLALDRVGLFLALGGGWEDVGTNGPAVDPSVGAKAP